MMERKSIISNDYNRVLYVIGNGFDIAHGLHTTYEDFRQWLLKQRNGPFIHSFEKLYPNVKNERGLWCDIERALGQISLKDAIYYDQNYQYCPDEVNNENSSLVAYRCGYHINNVVKVLPILLKEWAESIELDGHTPIFNFAHNAYFLTFNYTKTLEDIYGVKKENVLHIHEAVNEKKPLVVGCGDNYFEEDDYNPGDDSVDMNKIKNLLLQFKKPVKTILQEPITHKWFKSLKDISNVVVFGHSCSQVDKPYFEELSKNISSDATWTIYVHNAKGIDNYLLFAKSIKKEGQKVVIKNS